jgi:hypothetical protein
MTIKILGVVFASLVFLSATVCVVWGQGSSLGVKAGDSFVYSFSTTWQSNQTGVEPTSSIANSYGLQYIAFVILSVDGVSVTTNTSYCYSTSIMSEVDTSDYGGGFVPFFIPTNLGVGDFVPSTNSPTGPVGACYLNETVSQTFGLQTRTASHLQIEFPAEGFTNVPCNAYWDQATGVLTQVIYSYSNQTGDTATSWSVKIELNETSLFGISSSQSPSPSPSVPEFPAWTILLLILASVALTILATKRKKLSGSLYVFCETRNT